MSLHEELRDLVHQIAACPKDEIADLAMDAANLYKRERFIALGLAAVDAIVTDGPDLEENDPRLVAVQEQFRDRLKALVAWAKETGRM